MLEYILLQYQYDFWAFQLLYKFLRQQNPSKVILQQLSHAILAQEAWYRRLVNKGTMTKDDIWVTLSLSESEDQLIEMKNKWGEYLSKLTPDNIYSIIRYQNLQGEAFQTPLYQILTHILNHGTHHRGFIMALMKEEEIAVPALDMIIFYRELNP